MIRVKTILTALCLTISMLANAQEVTLQQQFENELKSKSAGIESISCKFTQIREMAILQNVVKKGGDFYFQHPGNMLLAFNDGDYIKLTEAWFEMKTGDRVNTTKVTANPMLKNLSAILSACVIGDFEQLTKGFTLDVKSSDEEWVVKMTPQRGRAASKISQIVLHFDRKTMSLNSLKMEEKTGDYTMYGFHDKRFNVAVADQLFNMAR